MMTSLRKTCGLKIQSLTKTECLYVATKFNDEVGAQKFTFSHSHFHILRLFSRDFGRRLSK